MDELYVLARQVLLDALEALDDHRDAIVLVGAQAIYLHVGDANLAVAPFTSDCDLVLDPEILGKIPPLEMALCDAGFLPKKRDSIGLWVTHRASSKTMNTEVCVDLLVPANVSPGKGRRAARLTGHDVRAARKVVGLEGTLVDLDQMQLGALADYDTRVLKVKVAGPAALLVSKLIKINDRSGTNRHSDKDALDIARLLRGIETVDLYERMKKILADPSSKDTADRAIELLRTMFSHRAGQGIGMAIRATGGIIDAEELAISCVLLASDLLDVLKK